MEQQEISITKRHIARCLSKLEEINTADIIKDTVKTHFWYLAEDLSKEQVNGGANGNR